MTSVALAHTTDRKQGVAASIRALDINPVKNKAVLIKPNFNTADPAPGSTHNDTLLALVDELWNMGASKISLGERSYQPTHQVMEEKGIIPLLAKKDVRIIDFDQLAEGDWVPYNHPDLNWKSGFRVARPIIEAECLVSTCCLKTHQFGGVITMALKNSVGVVPTFRNGFDFMNELHTSPQQQALIAEINLPFSPDLVVMDGVDAFVDGGPADGKRVRAEVVVATTDRVANDAVGTAILKHLGSNTEIMSRKIFEQGQIERAVELGIGAASATEIELVAADNACQAYVDQINTILRQG
jgi:uncharacterized protein (DUF362 family)